MGETSNTKRSYLGNRVLKEVHSGDINAPKAITWYVRAADGNVLAVYTKAGAPGPILTGENQEQQSIARSAPPMAMAGEGGPGSGDEDSDGIGDIIDNCPEVANHDQEDMDSDGMGDACDPDKDGDGIPNALDQCPDTYNPGQTDTNHDGCEDEQGGGTGGDIQLAELHIYGRSRLGMMKPDGVTMAPEENRVSHNVDVALEEHNSVYVRRVNRKQYELVDHLGNVRVVITDVKTTSEPLANDKPQGPYKATLLASNNYYPFGMLQPERHWSTEEYRYGYNGKEMDNEAKGEGNSYDFGARIYDPRVGRWLSTDPLQAKYTSMSPYNAFADNPILFVDPDGRVVQLYERKNGKTMVVQKFSHQSASDGLNAYLNTKEGYAYTAQFAKKGQTIAGVTFKEDGVFSESAVLQLQVSDEMGDAVGSHLVGVTDGTSVLWNEDNSEIMKQAPYLVVVLTVRSSLENYAGNTKPSSGDRTTDIMDYAVLWGHESILHGYNDGKIAEALKAEDFVKAAKIMGTPHNDEDHKGLLNNSPDYKTFLVDYFQSLQQFTKEKWNMSSYWTDRAKKRHIDHARSVLNETTGKPRAQPTE